MGLNICPYNTFTIKIKIKVPYIASCNEYNFSPFNLNKVENIKIKIEVPCPQI